MRVFYLHGFASSAASTKAGFFAARLREHGITLDTPDLNQPDFSTLTISRMVDQTIARIESDSGGDVVLIGSSLGAFVAVQVAVTLAQTGTGRPAAPQIERLVLLAPALHFAVRGDLRFGDRSLDEWQRTGLTNVFHYGYGRTIPVGYELYADACGYDCVNARLTMPIQIFQGTHDTVVDPAGVQHWAQERPNVDLHLLEDDHQLGRSLDQIWHEMKRFLQL